MTHSSNGYTGAEGGVPAHYGGERSSSSRSDGPLHDAAKMGDLDTVRRFVKDSATNINGKNEVYDDSIFVTLNVFLQEHTVLVRQIDR